MLQKQFLFGLLCQLLLKPVAQGQLLVAKVPTEVSFTIKNAGLNVQGTFSEATTDICFDEQKPERSLFLAKANVGSINTGIRIRDRHLLKEDYFHATQYPDIQMKSRRVSCKDGQNWEGEFDLTMRGITRTLIIPFTCQKTALGTVFSAQFTINRLDFQVGKSSWIMDDEVKVRVEIISQ
jgi:polyisoprenoid-binding protein YceI